MRQIPSLQLVQTVVREVKHSKIRIHNLGLKGLQLVAEET